MSEGGPIESPVGAPAHQGFLSKRSDWLRVWRTRFFKLYMGAGGPRLYFMKDADAPPQPYVTLPPYPAAHWQLALVQYPSSEPPTLGTVPHPLQPVCPALV